MFQGKVSQTSRLRIRYVPQKAPTLRFRLQQRLQIGYKIDVTVVDPELFPNVLAVPVYGCNSDAPELRDFLVPHSVPDQIADADFRGGQRLKFI